LILPVADVGTLLPHAGPARFVESVVGLREDGIECAGRIPPENALVRDGKVGVIVGVELAAQAAAVFEALRRRSRGERAPASPGLLVSMRDVQLARPELTAGAPLLASVRALGGKTALALYEVLVSEDGALALQGTIGAYLPDAATSEGGHAG
jgi:predicted hotdog family 3-hydroxylacyl-ACP dehydratase